MKILVPIKRVPDPDHRIRVSSDESQIDLQGVPCMVNPFDAIALEEAVRLRERSVDVAEIAAVSIGSMDAEEQLRTALAVGADRAIRVEVDEPLDPWGVASYLAAVTERFAPDLVLMGKQAIDDDCHQVGQFLAARLDWPQATCVSAMERTETGVRVRRETDLGIETLALPLPAVVTVDLRLNEPRYASVPSIMRARKKGIESLGSDELGVVVETRMRVLKVRVDQSTRKSIRVQNVQELLDRLQNDLESICT